MNSYKSQTFSLVRDQAEVPVKHYALLDDVARQPRRRSRATMTVIMVVIGLLAGWVGGISLTGAFQHSKPADVSPNVHPNVPPNVPPNAPPNAPMDENAVPASQLQPDPRASANAIAPKVKSARPREEQAQPDVEMQPPRATPIDEDKGQGDRWLGVPTREQSTKEIGQGAMDKILKENDKIKRGKHLRANKNEE